MISIFSWLLLGVVVIGTSFVLGARIWALINGFCVCNSPNFHSDDNNIEMLPKVVVHLAIRNENSDIVIETLKSLLNIDYPNFQIMVIDNNTKDKNLWLPVQRFCELFQEEILFFHEDNLSGYKAGALNYLLQRTEEDVQYIAIVDSDTVVESFFLKKLIPLFSNKQVAIVQSPLGFKEDPRKSTFGSWCFLIYRFYLTTFMPSAAKTFQAPFIGAMGIIRQDVLKECGGWNGFYLTEDMELSFRILAKGYSSCFTSEICGKSMPPEALISFKKQHYRWNFGNVQIYRDYLLHLVKQNFHFRKKKQKEMSYLWGPSIYINIYFLPFIVIACLLPLLQMVGRPLQNANIMSGIMLCVIVLDLLVSFITFMRLRFFENATWIDCWKNLITWLSLLFNNSVSTWATLLFKTKPFEITDKGQCEKQAFFKGKKKEVFLGGGILVFALLFWTYFTLNSLVLILLATLLLLNLIIPVC